MRALRRLAIHPGPEFDVFAAAALLNVTPVEAVSRLAPLLDRRKLIEQRHRRYRIRGKVPAIAAPEQRRALHRLADYYLRAAEQADRAITSERFRLPLVVEHTHAVPVALDDYDSALAWLTRERRNLAAVCAAAGRLRLDTACWQLTYTLRGYYYLAKLLWD